MNHQLRITKSELDYLVTFGNVILSKSKFDTEKIELWVVE